MIEEFEKIKNERKLAKKEKRRAGRKKRLKRWGAIGLCVLIFLGASTWGIVKGVQSMDGTLKKYEDLVNALSETVNVENLVVDKIIQSDYSNFITTCTNSGINILVDGKLHSGDLTITSSATFSGNEIGAYVNKAIENEDDVFKILEVSLYRDGEKDYIKTVSQINIAEVNSDASKVEDMPELIYLTTTSELYKYRNKLEIRNSVNKINNLNDETNKLIFDALMGEEFDELDGIMNSVLVEKINEFITRSGAIVSYEVANNVIKLVFTPAE